MTNLEKYLFDFTYIETKNIPLSAESVLKEISIEGCSMECVTGDGLLCKSFDYCPESKTCLLNSKSTQDSSSTTAKYENCGYYRSLFKI